MEPRRLTGEERGQTLALGALIEKEEPFPSSVIDASGTLAGYLLHPKIDLNGLGTRPDKVTLESHALDDAMLDALLSGDEAAFLAQRSQVLVRHVQATLREWTGLDDADHDRPPLDSYFDAESA